MPILRSTEEKNFQDYKVAFEISYGSLQKDKYDNKSEKWRNYKLIIHFQKKTISFKSIKKTSKTCLGTEAEIGKFAFLIEPKNEIEELKKSLKLLISKAEKKSLIFQPLDPSFEIEIKKLNPEEFKVYFWVDAGNSSQLEYSWDSIGLRFITNRKEIEKFIEEL